MEPSNVDVPPDFITNQEQNQQHPRSIFIFSDDMWSCAISLLTFSLFVSMTLIYGFYASIDIQLGPNCSRLLQTNPFFVKNIKVSKSGHVEPGNFMLYGFHDPPPLETHEIWSEFYDFSLPTNFHQKWIYYFNKGAQINITYNVKSKSNTSDSLIIAIAQGKESFIQWLENPALPNITSSWNLIQGSGVIEDNIMEPSVYYVAIGNINQQDVEVVQLEFKMQNMLHNTTKSYYNCSITHNSCVLGLQFFGQNYILLTSESQQAENDSDYNVTVSYVPRYMTYFIGSGVVTVTILLGFNFISSIVPCSGSSILQYSNIVAIRGPLLEDKVDDDTSLGSSYDSVSQDDGDDQEPIISLSKLMNECDPDGSRTLCSICFDNERNCFFLPCGHCATCFACGTRIANEDGNCPICRRKTKKVRKILVV